MLTAKSPPENTSTGFSKMEIRGMSIDRSRRRHVEFKDAVGVI